MTGTKRFIAVFGLLVSCVFQFLAIRPAYSAVPTITSIAPDLGTTASSTRITVTGENFEPGAKVSLVSGGPFLAGSNDVSGRHVHISGNYAYVAAGQSGLKVLDLSTFSSPELVGSIDITGSANTVYVYGDYAYVNNVVIDISDPTSPALVASIPVRGSVKYVAGNYAYFISTIIIADASVLTIVDISDPTAPKIAGTFGTEGIIRHVQVSGSYAYATYTDARPEYRYDPGARLLVIDISDPTALVTVGSYGSRALGSAFGVYVSGDYAYVAAGQSGLQIIDISDPASPVWAGAFQTSSVYNKPQFGWREGDFTTGSVKGVYVADDYAYLVGEPGLYVIDVSDPASPVLAAAHDTRGAASNVSLADGYIYLSDRKGLLQIDVSNPRNPAVTGITQPAWVPEPSGQPPLKTSSVHMASGYAYINTVHSPYDYLDVARFYVIDIDDPSRPVVIGSDSATFDYSILTKRRYDVYVAGDYAYQVLYRAPAFRVLDISNPTLPVLAGEFHSRLSENLYYKVGSLHVLDNYIYLPFIREHNVEGTDGWLLIVDISDPTTPIRTSAIKIPGESYGVYVSGAFAYVASGQGLVVVDISDPATPFVVGGIDTPGFARSVSVSGDYAYLADGARGLSVMDISDASAPFIVGNYDTPGAAQSVHVSNNQAYLVDGTAGLIVIDISNPSAPFLADSIKIPPGTNDVYVSGGYAALAHEHIGFILTATHDLVTDVAVVNSSTINATFPAGLPEGPYHILVTNPGGQTEEAYLYNAFKAEILPASETKHKCCMKHHRKGNKGKKGRAAEQGRSF